MKHLLLASLCCALVFANSLQNQISAKDKDTVILKNSLGEKSLRLFYTKGKNKQMLINGIPATKEEVEAMPADSLCFIKISGNQQIIDFSTKASIDTARYSLSTAHYINKKRIGIAVEKSGTNGKNICTVQCYNHTLPLFQGREHHYFTHYIKENLVFPEDYKGYELNEKVVVSFLIDTTGKVGNVRILQGNIPTLKYQVAAAVINSPQWEPACCNGVKMKVRLSLPVTFQSRDFDTANNANTIFRK